MEGEEISPSDGAMPSAAPSSNPVNVFLRRHSRRMQGADANDDARTDDAAQRTYFRRLSKAFAQRSSSSAEIVDGVAPPPEASERSILHKTFDISARYAKRVPYYVPVLTWIFEYRLSYLLPDLLAGIAVSAMLIPQSLAYASLAGLTPEYGLFTSFSPLLLYLIFGTSRQLSLGPEALVSILVGISVASITEAPAPVVANLLTFLVGLFLLVLGLIRFGFLDNVLSQPLLSGFVNAVACLIIVEQLGGLIGQPNVLFLDKEGVALQGYQKLPVFVRHLYFLRFSWTSLVVAVGSIAFLLGFRSAKRLAGESSYAWLRWLRLFPDILLLVVVSILLTWLLRLDRPGRGNECDDGLPCCEQVNTSKVKCCTCGGLLILGSSVPELFTYPRPSLSHLTSLELWQDALPQGLFIAIVGFIESIIVAKTYARKNGYNVSSNRELVALGASNFIGSFLGSYPAFASLTRSSVANSSGAKTQIFALVAAFIILLTMLFMGPLFYFLPKCVLSAIVVCAALSLFEFDDLLFLWKLRAYWEILLMLVCFLLTSALGVEIGVIACLGISVLIVIRTSSLPHVEVLGRVPETRKYVDITQHSSAQTHPGVLVLRINDSLYFANVGMIREMFSRIERLGSFYAHPTDKRVDEPTHTLVLDFRNVMDVDASACETLSEMAAGYRERSVRLIWVKLRGDLRVKFLAADILDPMKGDTMFYSLSDAVDAALRNRSTDHSVSSYSKYRDRAEEEGLELERNKEEGDLERGDGSRESHEEERDLEDHK